MSITAKELAEKLGLSAAAVSMALNNKPGVSTQTRQRVLDAATQYGYDMTRISMKRSGSREIAFLIYKRHGTIVTDTAFFSELFEGVSEGCRELGYRLNIHYFYDEEEPWFSPGGQTLFHEAAGKASQNGSGGQTSYSHERRQALSAPADGHGALSRQLAELNPADCAGVILLGTELTAERYPVFTSLPVPMILLDTYFETIPANYVLINNMQGAYQATSYLIRRTKKQPGYLKSSYSIGNFEERSHGFYDAVRAGGMSASRSIVHRLSPSVEGAFSDMMELLEAGEQTAPCYFADNDLIAVGAMRAFKAKGYRIPEDISIAGFDNISYGNVVEPGLTTIHVPKKEMGHTAVLRLDQILEQRQDIPMKIEIATRLIKRGSA